MCVKLKEGKMWSGPKTMPGKKLHSRDEIVTEE